MLRVLSQTILGLILLIAGIYLAFIFLQGLADGTGTWAIFYAIPMLISGILLLFRAGKSDATVIKKKEIPQLGGSQGGGGEENFSSQLQKNNAMMEAWRETNESRDRLHMLSLSEEADKPVN